MPSIEAQVDVASGKYGHARRARRAWACFALSLGVSLFSSGDRAAGQSLARTSGGETFVIEGERPGEKITVRFGKFAKYFAISKVKYVEDSEVDGNGRVVDFRRVTFVATARHPIATVPFASVRFTDADGISLPGPKGEVRRPGYILFGGGGLDGGEKIKCYIDLHQRRPSRLDVIVY